MIELVKISRSPRQFKKYRADAVIDGVLHKNVDFGDIRFEQFADTTPLGLYRKLDHRNEERKRKFHLRHRNNNGPASRLSKQFLWS